MDYEPIFAKPPCVIEFSTERAFIDLLIGNGVPYWEWGEEARSKAWTEVVEGDAVYSQGQQFGVSTLIRCICVVSMQVKMYHPDHGLLVLVEYKLNARTNYYEPRRSLSEKMLVDPVSGVPVETPMQTIMRCFEQETGMGITQEELSAESAQFLPQDFFEPDLGTSPPRFTGFGEGAQGVEEDYSPSSKFPGLLTYRQVAKYVVDLDARHYRATGYQDPSTRYYAKWRTVHKGRVLQPISAATIKRKRAVA